MTRKPKPVNIAFRIPVDLYEAVDAYAEHEDVNLSEALRRLVVSALEAQQVRHLVQHHPEDDGEPGPPLPDAAWKQPLAAEDQD